MKTGIARTVIQAFSRIFMDIQGYRCIFSHFHQHPNMGDGGRPPLPLIEKQKKYPDLGKTGLQ